MYAKLGANVVVNDMNEKAANAVVAEITKGEHVPSASNRSLDIVLQSVERPFLRSAQRKTVIKLSKPQSISLAVSMSWSPTQVFSETNPSCQ